MSTRISSHASNGGNSPAQPSPDVCSDLASVLVASFSSVALSVWQVMQLVLLLAVAGALVGAAVATGFVAVGGRVVAVGGTAVAVGAAGFVAVGGTVVAVGGTAVAVGTTRAMVGVGGVIGAVGVPPQEAMIAAPRMMNRSAATVRALGVGSFMVAGRRRYRRPHPPWSGLRSLCLCDQRTSETCGAGQDQQRQRQGRQ